MEMITLEAAELVGNEVILTDGIRQLAGIVVAFDDGNELGLGGAMLPATFRMTEHYFHHSFHLAYFVFLFRIHFTLAMSRPLEDNEEKSQ